MKEDKQLLFSISKDNGDFVVQPFKGSGNGGQKRNKTMSACRITHPASGTVSECQEERSFPQNKRKAFERLLKKENFIKWHKRECLKHNGVIADLDEQIEKDMRQENIRVEVQVNGRWVKSEV